MSSNEPPEPTQGPLIRSLYSAATALKKAENLDASSDIRGFARLLEDNGIDTMEQLEARFK